MFDEVLYKDEKYYVISNSSQNQKFVTLFKAEPLTVEDILKYDKSIEYNTSVGFIHYFTSNDCFRDDGRFTYNGCIQDYSNSNVKKVVDNWNTYELKDEDLVEVDGYKARIISTEEYDTFLNDDSKKYIVESEIDYWMTGLYDVTSYRAIRPVINLKKNNDIEYYIGKIINYKDNDYYVINFSGDDYVTLLKKEPLSKKQIMLYFNNYGVMSYYNSDTCNDFLNVNGCTTDFNKSFVKIMLDNWANGEDIMKDLVTANNYKIRLITESELTNKFGYSHNSIITQYTYDITEDVPEWVYNKDYSYWTMSSRRENSSCVYVMMNSGIADLCADYVIYNENKHIYGENAVRPVINLNKCALDGGCYEADEEIANGCLEENNNKENTVEIENTLKLVSKVLLCVSVVLIIGGFVIIFYNYYLVKKK